VGYPPIYAITEEKPKITSPPNPLSEAERGNKNEWLKPLVFLVLFPLSASERGLGGEVVFTPTVAR
jgi:hypothetical protein